MTLTGETLHLKTKNVDSKPTTMGSISVTSTEDDNDSYDDGSANDLTLISGAFLLMADCLGTGILALPHDVEVLGRSWGIAFILINLPINWYAGTILSNVAKYVELRDYDNISGVDVKVEENDDKSVDEEDVVGLDDFDHRKKKHETEIHATDRSTYDFIGITNALFLPSNTGVTSYAPIIVTTCYYCNIFLVLGNYILVMSHAVRALIGESNICLPSAGIVASTLMFALAQMRTMAKLGRWATFMSLTALLIVVIQCLIAAQRDEMVYTEEKIEEQNENTSILRKFASLSSIGFAVGSQKLFLNIRHEMKDRNQAPSSLGICLFAFGSAYVLVCLGAGASEYPL